MQQRSEIYKTVGAGRKIYVGVGQSHELLLPERHRSAKGAGSRKESAGKSYPGVRHGGNVRSVFTWYFDEDNDCPFITMDYGGGERYAYPFTDEDPDGNQKDAGQSGQYGPEWGN